MLSSPGSADSGIHLATAVAPDTHGTPPLSRTPPPTQRVFSDNHPRLDTTACGHASQGDTLFSQFTCIFCRGCSTSRLPAARCSSRFTAIASAVRSPRPGLAPAGPAPRLACRSCLTPGRAALPGLPFPLDRGGLGCTIVYANNRTKRLWRSPKKNWRRYWALRR